MLPNYSGRLLDKLIVIATQQTGSIRENPDDPQYVPKRVLAMKRLVRALWKARNELQAKRDPGFKP